MNDGPDTDGISYNQYLIIFIIAAFGGTIGNALGDVTVFVIKALRRRKQRRH